MLNAGYLRVFDYYKEQLVCGGKSYYGALLCCAWRSVTLLVSRSSPIVVSLNVSFIVLDFSFFI